MISVSRHKYLVCILALYFETINAKFYSKHFVKERDTQCWKAYLESKSNSAVECVSRCRFKGKRSLMVDEKCYCLPWHNDSLEDACMVDEVEDDTERDGNSILYQCK